MSSRLILGIVSVFMLLITIKGKDQHLKFIVFGFTLAFLSSWFKSTEIQFLILPLFSISLIATVVYGIMKKGLPSIEKVALITMASFAIITLIFQFNHWPYGSEFLLISILPVLLYAILIFKGLFEKDTFGVLTILSSYFLIRFLKLFS